MQTRSNFVSLNDSGISSGSKHFILLAFTFFFNFPLKYTESPIVRYKIHNNFSQNRLLRGPRLRI